MQKKELREASLFFAVTLALAYLVFWGPLAVFKVPAANLVAGTPGPVWALSLFILGGFVPSLTGIILTAVYEGRQGVRNLFRQAFRLGLGVKWYALILAVGFYLAVSLIALYTLLGGRFDYAQFLVQLPTMLPLIILGPLSEEFGWRGFAAKRLLGHVDANRATLMIGLVWALWHLPLFFVPGTSQSEFHMPFLAFATSVIGTSFVYTYLYLRTQGSLFSAIFLHWVHTYVLQVVSSSVTRSSAYNWLESLPGLLIGLVFAFLLRTDRVQRDRNVAG